MGYFLHFYSSNSPKNQNFEKMKKTPGDIIILHTYTKNYDQMMHSSWDVVHAQWTDRQMHRRTHRHKDAWKKWHIEVGALPKKWSRVKENMTIVLLKMAQFCKNYEKMTVFSKIRAGRSSAILYNMILFT